MRNINAIAIVFLMGFSIAISGCGKSDTLAPVSGTVTFEGKPVSKLRVAFSPLPIGKDYAVGPYSMGVTDSAGKFTLNTRYDDVGAVVGKHRLSFQYSDISETAMEDLRSDLAEAQEEGTRDDFNKVKKDIEKLKAKLKGRPVLEPKYNKAVVDIPSDGYQDLKLEITELVEDEKK